MISLFVVVNQILANSVSQRAFTKEYHPVETLFFDASSIGLIIAKICLSDRRQAVFLKCLSDRLHLHF